MDVGRLKIFPIKNFHPVPAALLGPGAHEMVGPSARELGFGRTLLMSTGLRGTGTVEEIRAQVEAAGVEVVVFDRVQSNPKDTDVMAAHAVYRAEACDSFISLGGGSSHDCTKATRVVAAHDGRLITDFKGPLALENPVLPPHIAVSTTAGTGSETSFAFVVTDTTTDPDNPHKFASFAHALAPTLAIDDPVLFYSLPADLTAFCGFDVLAHAVGAYVSILDMIPAHGPALHAIELLATHLRAAVGNGYDPVAREGMMYAQYIAGQAFNSAGLDAVHSVSHATSAYYDTHHGLGNAIATFPVWQTNLPFAYPKFARIAQALGVNTSKMSEIQAADAAYEAVCRLADDVDIPQNFTSLNSSPRYSKSRVGEGNYASRATIVGDQADCGRIALHALGDVCTVTNPRALTLESMTGIVGSAMVGSR
jgi:methanol:N,N-dimethyl-4-nitrosoaniline oxidoreductase